MLCLLTHKNNTLSLLSPFVSPVDLSGNQVIDTLISVITTVGQKRRMQNAYPNLPTRLQKQQSHGNDTY